MSGDGPNSFGPYHLIRKIGSGGMGIVWMARREGYNGPLVVKRLHRHLAEDKEAVTRLFDEVKHTRRLRHQNVVRVFDGGRIGDTYFLAMEWIEGLHLRSCVEASGAPLPPTLTASLARQAAAGLAAAHTAVDESGEPMGLVHRDVSPDNLMVNTSGTLKVLDFGIARSRGSLARTNAGIRHGKLLYIAPEYLEDGVASVRSDVYSLGMTMWEICTGHVPVEGCDPVSIVERIFSAGVPPANSVRPEIPAELSRIIAAATQIDPDDRPHSMEALSERLSAFLRQHRPPSRETVGRMVRDWKAALSIRAAAPVLDETPSEEPTDPSASAQVTEPLTTPLEPSGPPTLPDK